MRDRDGLEALLTLFTFTSKRALIKHARQLVITSNDFAHLIEATKYADIGVQHCIHHRDIVPEHLHLRPEEVAALSSGEAESPLKAGRKLVQAFKDRRFRVGHMFYTHRSKRWHFFYFDQRDLDADEAHWSYGPHVHFVNFLWPEYSAEGLWDEFTTGNPKIGGAAHIRWIDDSLSDA